MKIAIAIERYHPAGNPVERCAAAIAAELAQRGHEVTFLCVYHDEQIAPPPGISVKAMSRHDRMNPWVHYRYVGWVRQRLQGGGFHSSLSLGSAVPAAVVVASRGLVSESQRRRVARHESIVGRAAAAAWSVCSPFGRAWLAMERGVLADPLVRQVVAPSHFVAEQLHRRGLDPLRVHTITPALPIDRPDEAQRAAWRQMVRRGYGLDDRAVTFLHVGPWPPDRSARSLIHALHHLSRQNLHVALLLAGPTTYRQQRLAAHLGIRDRVKFVGWTEQRLPLYCGADVTLQPTSYDAASTLVLESLLMGTPAISTRWDGAAEWIVPAGAAAESWRGRVLDDARHASAWASAMAEMVDPAERARCTQACADVQQQTRVSRYVDQLLPLLEQARAADGGRPATA